MLKMEPKPAKYAGMTMAEKFAEDGAFTTREKIASELAICWPAWLLLLRKRLLTQTFAMFLGWRERQGESLSHSSRHVGSGID